MMFGTISRKLGPWLIGLMAILGFGAMKKRQGRKEAESDAAKETIERVEKGREAVRDGRSAGDPADRLRNNDGRW